MAHKELVNLVKVRQLKIGEATDAEIEGLIRRGLRKLQDSKKKDLSTDSRFDLVYNAAHALSLAALWHKGYRSESRFIVFQCTRHTIELDPACWRVLVKSWNKANSFPMIT